MGGDTSWLLKCPLWRKREREKEISFAELEQDDNDSWNNFMVIVIWTTEFPNKTSDPKHFYAVHNYKPFVYKLTACT